MSPSGSALSLSVAVVGVGEMGRNHARCLAAMKGVNLVAVVEADVNRCHEVAATFECQSVTSISDLPHVDAAIVAPHLAAIDPKRLPSCLGDSRLICDRQSRDGLPIAELGSLSR